MITYDDIKKILESVDIAKLEKDYMTRQEVNLLDNTMKAKDVLAYFPDELIYLPKGLDNIGKLNALLMLYLNSGHSSAKRLIIEILKKYGNTARLKQLIFDNRCDEKIKSKIELELNPPFAHQTIFTSSSANILFKSSAFCSAVAPYPVGLANTFFPIFNL